MSLRTIYSELLRMNKRANNLRSLWSLRRNKGGSQLKSRSPPLVLDEWESPRLRHLRTVCPSSGLAQLLNKSSTWMAHSRPRRATRRAGPLLRSKRASIFKTKGRCLLSMEEARGIDQGPASSSGKSMETQRSMGKMESTKGIQTLMGSSSITKLGGS
jgi:hypothetical protein